MATSMNFEVACYTPNSKALDFIGSFDNGTKVSVITKQGFGYTYQLPDGSLIDDNSLRNIMEYSVGKYWVKVLKPKSTLIDKDATAGNWQITADFWFDIAPDPAPTPMTEWKVGGAGLFAF
ncbi:MAG: hypothetical protein GW898_09295 [Thiomicrospira sp.]|nr:hypothetical protein [Thiomicrospira sp.]NCN66598.1 hypothetical protein [Thiomicrospira sp.]NCO14551.1 hypothetical protein [Thiomicrospira sp.]NCO82465.1 hypothetical protein [Thiomicrospira sp.]OIP95588.1 MAG: hypothetical protein AUK56_04905 [Thiomicrospira sp. CG2_30_44_34]